MSLGMCTRLTKALLTSLFKIFSVIKGSSTVNEIFKHRKIVMSIDIVTTNGITIKVFCQKRQYIRSHENSLFKSKIYTVFDVFSKTPEFANENLKEAFSISVTFPPLVSKYVDDRVHARILINAYLDMVNVRLNETTKVNSDITIH